MSDFTALELLKGHGRICPSQLLEEYNKGVALIESGNLAEGKKVLNDLAFDYDDVYAMPHFNDKLIDLILKLS